jgi:diguanylate cyclase (GGDEF)-like protein
MDGAKWVANHLRQRIAELNILHIASPLGHVTVSCGVAAVMPGDGVKPEMLLQSADYALYQAKQQGRNRGVGVEYGQANKEIIP